MNYIDNAISPGAAPISEAELENLANSMFPDFDAAACAQGIDALYTSGDTAVIDRAVSKYGNYFGNYSDYEKLANDLTFGTGAEIPGGEYAAEAISYAHQAENYSPVDENAYIAPAGGYAPSVMSEEQAKDYVPRTGTATKSIPQDNSGIIVGTKTLEQIRNDFPILKEKINGYDLVWLDNGATTQRPQAVIDRLSYYYEHENSNVHRGAHELAARSTDAYENARQITADFIGAPDKNNIVFVRGTTEAINLIANAYVKQYLQPGDEIILTMLEHHANIVPWQLVAQETGAVLRVAPVDETGQIILSEYRKLFNSRTKFVSATHVSNVLGTVTPIAEMIAIAHSYGVRILVDGAQSIAHTFVPS